jgi:hypothetical protein
MIIKTQAYDTTPFVKFVSNPIFINVGQLNPTVHGFVFQRQDLFGDKNAYDLTDFTINFYLYNDNDVLVVTGVFDILDASRGEIEYVWKDFETSFPDNYYVVLEFIYLKPAITEVLPIANFTIDFVASVIPFTYGVGDFSIQVNGVELLPTTQIIIDTLDTNEIIASKINTAINLENINGYTSTINGNKITLLPQTGVGSTLNNKSIIVTSDDKIVSSENIIFTGGVDAASEINAKFILPDKKNPFRVVID